jgi:hypothetical protein
MFENPDVGPEWFEQTFYHGKIIAVPGYGDGEQYPYFKVALYSASEDGTDLNYTGDFFNREEAERVVAGWRKEETRELMFLALRLTPVDNEAGPKP